MILVRALEVALAKPGMSPSRLGREAIGDPGLVRDLKRGRQLRPETRARLVAWLRRQGIAA